MDGFTGQEHGCDIVERGGGDRGEGPLRYPAIIGRKRQNRRRQYVLQETVLMLREDIGMKQCTGSLRCAGIATMK